MSAFTINLDDSFETLPNAPIVEAVIDIRVVPANRPEEGALRDYVHGEFADYSFLDTQREFQFQVKFSNNAPPNQENRDLGWKGLRFQSKDKRYVAQFNRDGFGLSRLEPYENWGNLWKEAERLWIAYAKLLQPQQISRVGLRYINRIRLPLGELNFESYLHISPSTPSELDFPVSGFMHLDTVVVPNFSYAINVIKTLQPPNSSSGTGLGLILDIDVATTHPLEPGDAHLKKYLDEMRWLKNKIFFGTITPKSLEMFR